MAVKLVFPGIWPLSLLSDVRSPLPLVQRVPEARYDRRVGVFDVPPLRVLCVDNRKLPSQDDMFDPRECFRWQAGALELPLRFQQKNRVQRFTNLLETARAMIFVDVLKYILINHSRFALCFVMK